MPKGLTEMQFLKAYHSPNHSLFIELVIVGMVLFQQQYQSLCPAIGFSFWVSGVNFGASGLSDAEKLVSPDSHILYLKGVVVFCKSMIPLCSNAFMVMSPHILLTVNDPFQLSLSPETAFCRKPLLSSGTSCVWFIWTLICVWTWDGVPEGCVQVIVIHILPWWLWIWWGLVPSAFQVSCCSPIFWINSGPSWTGGGTGRFLSSFFKAGFIPQYQFEHVLWPQAELCSFLTSTSGELTWVLLSQWLLSEPLEKHSCWQWTQQMDALLGECLQRGYPAREVLEKEEFQFDYLDCLRDP